MPLILLKILKMVCIPVKKLLFNFFLLGGKMNPSGLVILSLQCAHSDCEKKRGIRVRKAQHVTV